MHKKISTYNPAYPLPQWHFFILNKGKNSGRPAHKPNTNCFVFSAENYEQMEFYFWLCYGLWKSKIFERSLIGSVIPFIRKHELIQTIELSELKARQQYERFARAIGVMQSVTRQNDVISEQLKKRELICRSLLCQLLR